MTESRGAMTAQQFDEEEVKKILYQINDYPKTVRDSIRPTVDALRKLRDALSAHNTAAIECKLRDAQEEIKLAHAALGGNEAVHLCDRISKLRAALEAKEVEIKELRKDLREACRPHIDWEEATS